MFSAQTVRGLCCTCALRGTCRGLMWRYSFVWYRRLPCRARSTAPWLWLSSVCVECIYFHVSTGPNLEYYFTPAARFCLLSCFAHLYWFYSMSQLVSRNIIIATNLNYDRYLRFEAWSTRSVFIINLYKCFIYIWMYSAKLFNYFLGLWQVSRLRTTYCAWPDIGTHF